MFDKSSLKDGSFKRADFTYDPDDDSCTCPGGNRRRRSNRNFSKPVLVMRETTERPEGIEAGTARLVGTDKDSIVSEIFSLLDDEEAYAAMARAHNPFGDGTAGKKIAEIVARAR